MAILNAEKIKTLRKGELVGTVATVFCAVVVVYFAVGFSLSVAKELDTLQTVVLITAPLLLISGAAVAAFCNLKYGKQIEKLIDKYVTEIFIENAALMHPEKQSLSFLVSAAENRVEVTVNGYKDKIVFDFSVFGKLRAMRRLSCLNIVESRLSFTFCRLYERGANYTAVEYREKDISRNKTGKAIPVIVNGVPEVRAMKNYLKNK